MSYISRTGNLAAAPTLREGENGPYCFAKVIVSDRYKDKSGAWVDGPAIAYEVAVSGDEARRLVEHAQRDGHVGVTFAGRYRVTEWKSDTGSRHQHEVRADSIALAFRGQDVAVVKDQKGAPAPEEPAAQDDEPTDIYATGASE